MKKNLKNKKASHFCEALCEPDRIRTYDRLLRREVLYPAELRARSFIVSTKTVRGGRINFVDPEGFVAN
tara:strand:- start:22516 stop:22722 length:207 start_codon:yes stop_codon:yes gene_type:complete